MMHNAKEYVFREGDDGDLMYIILSGSCHVRVHNKYIEKVRKYLKC
jgi:CRP-like cAMP-binding protein